MSYDLYVFENIDPRPPTPHIAQVGDETLLQLGGETEASGYVLEFLGNFHAVQKAAVETEVGSSGVVIHLRLNDDAARTNVTLLASLSGLYLYDPQFGHLFPPGRRDGV